MPAADHQPLTEFFCYRAVGNSDMDGFLEVFGAFKVLGTAPLSYFRGTLKDILKVPLRYFKAN